jgi:hypothetical protein
MSINIYNNPEFDIQDFHKFLLCYYPLWAETCNKTVNKTFYETNYYITGGKIPYFEEWNKNSKKINLPENKNLLDNQITGLIYKNYSELSPCLETYLAFKGWTPVISEINSSQFRSFCFAGRQWTKISGNPFIKLFVSGKDFFALPFDNKNVDNKEFLHFFIKEPVHFSKNDELNIINHLFFNINKVKFGKIFKFSPLISTYYFIRIQEWEKW